MYIVKSLICVLGLSVIGCSSATDPSNNHLPIQQIGFDNVEIGGELYDRLTANLGRMETPLYQPNQVFWTEEESGGWPGDKEGRTILALVMDGRALHKEPQYLEQIISMIPSRINEKGYFGTIFDDIDEQQISGHGWLLRGLCEYFDWKNDSTVLEIAKDVAYNLFLPITDKVDDYPSTPDSRIKGAGDMSGSTQNTVNGWRLSSDIGCVFIGMDGLIHYYQYDRNPQIKSLIDKLINLYLNIDLLDVKAQTHASLTALRGLLRYMSITGDYAMLPEVEKRWDIYKTDGMTENYENFNWFGRFDTWTEPCAVIDSYMTANQLWQATRDSSYLEDAEHIYYNGLCVEQRTNGGFGCNKPVGPSFDEISIHADEAHWCCTMRGGEGLAQAAKYSYFTSGDTIFVPSYRESRLNLQDKGIRISQSSDKQYPFGSTIEFSLENMPTKEMTLALFAPDYIDVQSVYLNDEIADFNKKNGFIYVTKEYDNNDKISLAYSPKKYIAEASSCPQKVKVMYGPLILASDNDIDCNDFETLTPLYHMMNKDVCSENNYHRKVIFDKK